MMIVPNYHGRLKNGVQGEMEKLAGDQRKRGQIIILTLGTNVFIGLFWSGIFDTRNKKKDVW